MPLQTEVVVYNIESALNAQKGGAARVELCDNSSGGGTTPSAGTIQEVRNLLSISVFVMIRPREGDFCYSNHEFEVMKHDVQTAKKLGADGIVLGILNPDGTIDKYRCGQLIRLAAPLPVTCHRAFDMTRNSPQALQDCIEVGFTRILTSGQKATALEGLPLITKLVRQAGDDIIIMPGCGVSEETVVPILQESGANEIHISATTSRPSTMEFINNDIQGMGSAKGREYELQVVSPERVRKIRGCAEEVLS